MRYWLYPQYYGGGKGPTLRGALWKWFKRVALMSRNPSFTQAQVRRAVKAAIFSRGR
jgi:hypothetical protein